jgi:hypothetical protein
VADTPLKAVLEIGYSDSLYQRSRGGIAPSGWKCEHLPYLVEFDNFGGNRTLGQSTQSKGVVIYLLLIGGVRWSYRLSHSYEARGQRHRSEIGLGVRRSGAGRPDGIVKGVPKLCLYS